MTNAREFCKTTTLGVKLKAPFGAFIADSPVLNLPPKDKA